jgi:hypothetical protein
MLTDATIILIFYVLVGLVALVAVAAALRPVFLWLFGVNEVIRLLERQNQLLEKIAGETEIAPDASPVPPSALRPQ